MRFDRPDGDYSPIELIGFLPLSASIGTIFSPPPRREAVVPGEGQAPAAHARRGARAAGRRQLRSRTNRFGRCQPEEPRNPPPDAVSRRRRRHQRCALAVAATCAAAEAAIAGPRLARFDDRACLGRHAIVLVSLGSTKEVGDQHWVRRVDLDASIGLASKIHVGLVFRFRSRYHGKAFLTTMKIAGFDAVGRIDLAKNVSVGATSKVLSSD